MIYLFRNTHSPRTTGKNVSANFNKNIETARPGTQKKAKDNEFFEVTADHFETGLGAMYDSDSLRTLLATTPAEQKGPLQDKLNSDYQTAIREFELADRGRSANRREESRNDLGPPRRGL